MTSSICTPSGFWSACAAAFRSSSGLDCLAWPCSAWPPWAIRPPCAATRRSPAMLGLVLAFAVVLLLIADLDRGQEGLLRISQQSMIDLQEIDAARHTSMNTESKAHEHSPLSAPLSNQHPRLAHGAVPPTWPAGDARRHSRCRAGPSGGNGLRLDLALERLADGAGGAAGFAHAIPSGGRNSRKRCPT